MEKIEPTGQLDMDICQAKWIVEKVRNDDIYAQNLYAAMCNIRWQYQDVLPILKDQYWTVSWRTAGGIVADIRSEDGDYMDWYCSGSLGNPDNHGHTPRHYVSEGTVTEEIQHDLAAIGWHWSEWPD